MSLDKELQAIEDAKQNTEAKLKQLRERITQGESTGDPIQDFILYQYGTTNAELEKLLRALATQFDGKIGQQVLALNIIYAVEEASGCFGGGSAHTIEDNLRLGILTAPLTFNPKAGEIILPTEVYAQKKRDIWREKGEWKRNLGSIITNLYEVLQKPSYLHGPHIASLHDATFHYSDEFLVLFGEEVEAYFRTDPTLFTILMEQENDKLGQRLIAHNRHSSLQDINKEYGTALQLIGQDVPHDFR